MFARTDLLHITVSNLTAWLEAGTVQALTLRFLALAEMAEAHRALESGGTTGQVALRTAPPFLNAAVDGATVHQASGPLR
ncbi:zinc-binding dehydrogenase [Microvirga splendida]|uniref:Zinc-binding dehydrogenase n=1 Tax=Microvirga splendida TaxID=2795727 RepID=A0ABS0Y5Y4_9HYPH|nr:zinc-binding dehydrogenase [Microvirga splendida]